MYLKMSSADALLRKQARQTKTGRLAAGLVGWLAGWHVGVGRSVTGTSVACCAEFCECIVLLLWAWGARTQVNLKPIIRRAMWTLRIDTGDICCVIIVKYISSQYNTMIPLPLSETNAKL